MSDIKEVWEVFKMSSMQDVDMQRAFHRAVTPNACIELLEDIEELKSAMTSLISRHKRLQMRWDEEDYDVANKCVALINK